MNPSIPNHYDAGNAAVLAALASASYQPHAEFADWKTTVVACEGTDTLALVACDGVDCLVAFRGTQDLRNWPTDLDCAFTRLGNLRVHRGFYEAMESVRADLKAVVEEAHYQRLWLTGHSLGGALAMLCARAWDGAVDGVYTFGQPRAGDAAFRDDYNDRLGDRTFRVIHADDIVARVPWLLGAYRHAGHEVFFGSKMDEVKRKIPSSYVLDPSILSKIPSDLWNVARQLRHGQLALLDDHHISRYLALFPEPGAPCRAFHS
jgi:pimeloyl-ACP methyl ester carboxylesterase